MTRLWPRVAPALTLAALLIAACDLNQPPAGTVVDEAMKSRKRKAKSRK